MDNDKFCKKRDNTPERNLNGVKIPKREMVESFGEDENEQVFPAQQCKQPTQMQPTTSDFYAVDPSQNNCMMPQDKKDNTVDEGSMSGMMAPMPGSPSSAPIVNSSECEAAGVEKQLGNEESFKQACQVLTHRFQLGEYNERNAEFLSMVPSMYNDFSRLVSEKIKFEDKLHALNNKLTQKCLSNDEQFNLMGDIFKCALAQGVGDLFTEEQRQNIDTWKKETDDAKKANLENMLKIRKELKKSIETKEVLCCQLRAVNDEIKLLNDQLAEKHATLLEENQSLEQEYLNAQKDLEEAKNDLEETKKDLSCSKRHRK